MTCISEEYPYISDEYPYISIVSLIALHTHFLNQYQIEGAGVKSIFSLHDRREGSRG